MADSPPKSDDPVFDPRVQPSAHCRRRCWYNYFSDSPRLTHWPAARSEMTMIQPHVAELKRHTGLGEGRSLESEWSGAIKGLSATLKRKADGSLLDLDGVLCIYFLLGRVRHCAIRLDWNCTCVSRLSAIEVMLAPVGQTHWPYY